MATNDDAPTEPLEDPELEDDEPLEEEVDEDDQDEQAEATRPEGEDPWEVPCPVCGLLGCRRHT